MDEMPIWIDQDQFLIEEKPLVISARKYYIWDKKRERVLFIAKHPEYMFRKLISVLIGLLLGSVVGVIFLMLAAVLDSHPNGLSDRLQIFLVAIAIISGFATCFFVAQVLFKRIYVIIFYLFDNKKKPLFKVFKGEEQLRYDTFFVKDFPGELIAKIIRNCLNNTISCYTPDDSILFRTNRDPVEKSIIFKGKTGNIIGNFNIDTSILDMSLDCQRVVDRRVAIVVGVILYIYMEMVYLD